MLAHRIHRDIADNDHLFVFLFVEELDMALRIVLEPRENLFIHSGDPRGRFDKTLSVRILADRRKYLAYSRLDSLFVHHFTPVIRE